MDFAECAPLAMLCPFLALFHSTAKLRKLFFLPCTSALPHEPASTQYFWFNAYLFLRPAPAQLLKIQISGDVGRRGMRHRGEEGQAQEAHVQ